MILPGIQMGKEATERLKKLATASITKEREKQPCDAHKYLQMDGQ